MTDNDMHMSSNKEIEINCPLDGVKDGDLILCISLDGDFFNGVYYYNGDWNAIISSGWFSAQQMKDGDIKVIMNNDNIKRYISYITGPNH